MTSPSQTLFSAVAAAACVTGLFVGRPPAPLGAAAPPGAANGTQSQTPRKPSMLGIVGPQYFNTPDFKRRFAASFLSISDVEPNVTEDEAEELREIIKMIQTDSKRDRALAKLQKAITPTSSANYHFLIGQIHQAAERFDEALDAYHVAVDPNHCPTFRRAWEQIALLHYRRALSEDNEKPELDYRECANAYSRAISLGLVNKTAYGIMAASLLNIGKVIPAESAFRQAMMMDPENDQWRYGLAQSFFRGKRYADAAALLEGMISEGPDDASLWLLQGNAYLGLQKPNLAARNLQIVDQLGAATAESTHLLAGIYANDGLAEVAVDLYLKALSLDPEGTPDQALRAASLFTSRGEVHEATRLLDGLDHRFAGDMDPESRSTLLKLRAKIAVREGRGDEELEALRGIVATDPLDGDGLILLGQALMRSGATDEAFQTFETAASIDGFEAEAKLKHGQALVREKRFSEAVPLIKSSLQLADKETVRDYLENVEKAARAAARK